MGRKLIWKGSNYQQHGIQKPDVRRTLRGTRISRKDKLEEKGGSGKRKVGAQRHKNWWQLLATGEV